MCGIREQLKLGGDSIRDYSSRNFFPAHSGNRDLNCPLSNGRVGRGGVHHDSGLIYPVEADGCCLRVSGEVRAALQVDRIGIGGIFGCGSSSRLCGECRGRRLICYGLCPRGVGSTVREGIANFAVAVSIVSEVSSTAAGPTVNESET